MEYEENPAVVWGKQDSFQTLTSFVQTQREEVCTSTTETSPPLLEWRPKMMRLKAASFWTYIYIARKALAAHILLVKYPFSLEYACYINLLEVKLLQIGRFLVVEKY